MEGKLVVTPSFYITLYSRMFGCFIMVNTLFLFFLFITKDSVFKMASIQVLLQAAYVSLRWSILSELYLTLDPK